MGFMGIFINLIYINKKAYKPYKLRNMGIYIDNVTNNKINFISIFYFQLLGLHFLQMLPFEVKFSSAHLLQTHVKGSSFTFSIVSSASFF